MPWIDVIRPEAAEGELADLARAFCGARGRVANAHATHVGDLTPRARVANP